ncbi:MAG: prepilin-type N-terminal cleavage/methylation domain-containing protein [bacterium]
MRGHKGFTLIELLIVVAIIAILAAIAIPNFLAAQTRSKVSRAKGEQNMLATGLEAYFIDANVYPSPGRGEFYPPESRDGTPGYGAGEDGGLVPYGLTTPISYITSVPRDPFKKNGRGYYEYGGGPGYSGGAGSAVAGAIGTDRNYSGIWPASGWIVTSYGPDVVDGNTGAGTGAGDLREESCWIDSYGMGSPDFMQCDNANPLATSGKTYDPTNGTTSSGDLWRRGP